MCSTFFLLNSNDVQTHLPNSGHWSCQVLFVIFLFSWSSVRFLLGNTFHLRTTTQSAGPTIVCVCVYMCACVCLFVLLIFSRALQTEHKTKPLSPAQKLASFLPEKRKSWSERRVVLCGVILLQLEQGRVCIDLTCRREMGKCHQIPGLSLNSHTLQTFQFSSNEEAPPSLPCLFPAHLSEKQFLLEPKRSVHVKFFDRRLRNKTIH